jgi:hypothetical protein
MHHRHIPLESTLPLFRFNECSLLIKWSQAVTRRFYVCDEIEEFHYFNNLLRTHSVGTFNDDDGEFYYFNSLLVTHIIRTCSDDNEEFYCFSISLINILQQHVEMIMTNYFTSVVYW